MVKVLYCGSVTGHAPVMLQPSQGFESYTIRSPLSHAHPKGQTTVELHMIHSYF